jgi:hypothetical protein
VDDRGKIRIAYDGSALENGSMDVNDLAPALIAFSSLVNRANEVIGNKQPIRVMLKADDIKKGSFDVILELVYTALEQAKLFVGMADNSGITALIDVLGWGKTCGGIAVGGVFWLIKKIKGQTITNITAAENGYAKITLINGITIDVDEKTLKVYLDHEARERIEKVVEPLKRTGIDTFELRNPADYKDKHPAVAIEKDDLPYFKTPELTSLDEDAITNIQEMYVKIVSVVFDEKQKWRFSDGEIVFWAIIEDRAFWAEIENGTRAFRSGDKLKVKCEIHQYFDNGNPVTERRILEVLKVIERPTQIKLDFNK